MPLDEEEKRERRIRILEGAIAVINAMLLFDRDRQKLTVAEWLEVLDEVKRKIVPKTTGEG
jgi:hypothetical protein